MPGEELHEFEELLVKNQHRLRDQAIFEVRNCQIDDLTDQMHRAQIGSASEALMDFWQGDYDGCLRVLSARQPASLTPDEWALRGITLAAFPGN